MAGIRLTLDSHRTQSERRKWPVAFISNVRERRGAAKSSARIKRTGLYGARPILGAPYGAENTVIVQLNPLLFLMNITVSLHTSSWQSRIKGM